ncbi:hypothetical protein PPYR_15371, partial [Photinus pyralis]
LQVTLRFLATGESFRSLMYSSRIHEIREWEIVAKEFEELWQFPQCLVNRANRSANFARDVRKEYSEYFNSPCGIVEWQEAAIKNCNM